MTREEYRRKKKGANYSDEYDDEEDDSFWEDSDYERNIHDSTSAKVLPANESQETDPGKLKGKNGKLQRPAGISEKEWNRMNREE